MTVLEKMRRQLNLSQQELSRVTGVPQSVISAIESGGTKFPRIDTAKKLAEALNATVDAVFQNDCGNESDTTPGKVVRNDPAQPPEEAAL